MLLRSVKDQFSATQSNIKHGAFTFFSIFWMASIAEVQIHDLRQEAKLDEYLDLTYDN